MKLLLDEQLDSTVAEALNVYTPRLGASFESLRTLQPGLLDPDIPAFCERRDFAALVTANVKDFGARQALYEALLVAGVSVVVVRPGRQVMIPEVQASILLGKLSTIIHDLKGAGSPVLLSVTQGGIRLRTLDELRREIEGTPLP